MSDQRWILVRDVLLDTFSVCAFRVSECVVPGDVIYQTPKKAWAIEGLLLGEGLITLKTFWTEKEALDYLILIETALRE